MATAAPSRPSADAKLRGELSRAARSIRVADASGGLLALAAIALGYTAVMVAVDRFADLPAWARGVALGVTLTAAAGVAFFRVYRPLVRAVNPRYAARQVESVSPGAKNAVINWVDLENEQLGETVRASLASRAATQVAAADAHKLAESRLTTGLLVACGVLVAVLAGLFLWLKPAPFLSLITRAYNPFTVATIATRSEIVLDQPAGGDATVLAGDPLPVRVGVNGRVPDASSPDRPRLLIRYTQDAAVPEEYPLPAGAGPREFAADLPASVVQNGFWYAVAAGDSRTPEYRVTVRPRPVVTAYRIVTTYPEYTRLKPETTTDPRVEALRGSEIELTVTGNRPLKDGQLRLTSQAVPVAAEPVAGQPEQLRFRLSARESGQYRVTFTTAEGEVGDPTASHQLQVFNDAKPVVTISTPSQEEIALPTTGTLAVDGLAADDFGVSAVALKLQLAGTQPKLLQPLPYRGGKSLQRKSDGSFPTRVEVKLSAALAELKLQSGKPANVAGGVVIEYWLEAADNCTLPQSNVGRSKVQRVKVGPAPSPEQQADQKQQRERRQGEEQAHNQKQDQQFQQEPRDQQPKGGEQEPQKGQNSDPKPDQNQPPKQGDNGNGSNGGNAATKPDQPQPGKPSGEQKPSAPKPGESQPPKPGEGQKPDPKEGQEPGEPQKGAADLQPKKGDAQPQNAGANRGGEPQPKPSESQGGEPKPDAQSQQDTKLQEEAQRVQDAANAARDGKPQQGQKPPTDAQRKELEQAARDLASGDKEKQQAARDKLDSMIGEKNRQKAEADAKQIEKDLRSDNKETREAAQKKVNDAVNEMKKQAGDKAAGDASQAARDLNSPDPKARDEAKGTLDKTVGPENREKLEKQAARPSGQPGAQQKSDALAKDAEKMAREQSQSGDQPDKTKQQEIQDAAKDLTSTDPDKRQAAEKKLDDLVGKENREAAQKKANQLKQDLESGDKDKQEKAQQELKDMAKAMDDAKPKGGGESNPNADGQKPGEPKAEKAGEKPKTQKGNQAAGADDEKSGEGQPQSTKPAEEGAKPGKSGESVPNKEPANKKTETKSNTGKQGAKSPGTEESAKTDGTKEGPPKAGDHTGGRDGQKPPGADQADPKLGDKPGSGEGKRPVDPKNAPKGSQNRQGQPEDGKPNQEQPGGEERPGTGDAPKPDAAKQKELADAADKLANGTPAEQEAAREKLDREIGKENRQKAEADAKQLAEDLNSGDPQKKAAAKQKLDDLREKMAEQSAANKPGGESQQGGQQPTPEQRAEWEQKAKDLNSPDPAKKQAAEEAFDNAIGKDQRQELQQSQKDAQGGTPKSREQAQKQIDRAAKQPGKRNGPGGGGPERKGDKLVENEKNRLKTAELQLADLEKIKNDPALRQRVGYTPEQYEAFLKSVREAVARQRADVAKLEAQVKKGAGPAALNVGGTQQVEAQKGTTGGDAAGPGVPPEGFADALKRFGQEVNKSK